MPESTALDVFASNFRALSSRANLTQVQLAEIAGASQSTVGTWLRGEQSPGVVELARLCRHFGRIVNWKELQAMRAELEERKRRKPHKGG